MTLQKNSMWLAILVAFVCSTTSMEASKPVIKAKMVKPVAKIQEKTVVPFKKGHTLKLRSAKADATGTAYNYPGVLPYDGYGTYISFNTLINDYSVAGKEDYIFFPKDSATTYIDASTNSPSSYLWNAPGATPAVAETQDMDVVYGQEGRFAFPTLTAGGSSYTATGSIKVGGKAEICSFNSFMLDSTYIPYDPSWQDNYGFVAGSNGWSDLGFGNLVFLGQDSATVESVSVYIRPNPTAANPDNKVKLTIYETGDDADGYFIPNKKVLATSELKISEMMPGSSSVTGISYANGQEVMGLANFKFAAPVKVGSYFFAAVENFGNDLAKKDSFCIMMNPLDPIPADSFQNVASNSSWSFSDDGNGGHAWYGLYYYLDFNPVLMICPVVNYSYKSTDGIVAPMLNQTLVTRFRNGFTIMGAKEGEKVSVYSLNGQKVLSGVINASRQNFTVAKGMYLVKVGNTNHKILIQ
ncbi:MAG: T9SS type A sorting domain-containing protein [Bacteroidales bacterium]